MRDAIDNTYILRSIYFVLVLLSLGYSYLVKIDSLSLYEDLTIYAKIFTSLLWIASSYFIIYWLFYIKRDKIIKLFGFKLFIKISDLLFLNFVLLLDILISNGFAHLVAFSIISGVVLFFAILMTPFIIIAIVQLSFEYLKEKIKKFLNYLFFKIGYQQY